MKLFQISIGQDLPEPVEQAIAITARDITEAVVITSEVIDSIREGIAKTNVSPEKISGLRILEISEMSDILNFNGKMDPKVIKSIVDQMHLTLE